jgi:hypothetical protein
MSPSSIFKSLDSGPIPSARIQKFLFRPRNFHPSSRRDEGEKPFKILLLQIARESVQSGWYATGRRQNRQNYNTQGKRRAIKKEGIENGFFEGNLLHRPHPDSVLFGSFPLYRASSCDKK